MYGRDATAEELAVRTKQVDNGGNMSAFMKDFFASAEFQSKSTAEKITALYRTILGREPDGRGLQGWIDTYEKGASLADIAKAFTNCSEFKNKSANWKQWILGTLKVVEAAKSDFHNVTGSLTDSRKLVNDLFKCMFGRDATADELALRAKQVDNGGNMSAFMKDFFASAEFQNKSSAEKITALYRTILGREPDAKGLQGWVDTYEKGASLADIAKAFTNCSEFQNKSANWKEWILNTLKVTEAAKSDQKTASSVIDKKDNEIAVQTATPAPTTTLTTGATSENLDNQNETTTKRDSDMATTAAEIAKTLPAPSQTTNADSAEVEKIAAASFGTRSFRPVALALGNPNSSTANKQLQVTFCGSMAANEDKTNERPN